MGTNALNALKVNFTTKQIKNALLVRGAFTTTSLRGRANANNKHTGTGIPAFLATIQTILTLNHYNAKNVLKIRFMTL